MVIGCSGAGKSTLARRLGEVTGLPVIHLDRVVYGATIEDANRYCRQIQIPAEEVARRSDMQCEVVGPFLRELCNTLFDDPRMQATFATWNTRKETA